MAKDFDFIPAKRPPTKRVIPQQPPLKKRASAPRSVKAQGSLDVSPKPKRTSQSTPPARIHQTRSSLIDYHPVGIAGRAKPKPIKTPAAPLYLPPARKISRPEPEPKKRFNKKTVVSAVIAFIVIVLLASGLLIPILENPSVTIIIYIIAAIIFRLNSRVSFSIALLLLLAIPVLLLIRNSALAGTYAIFCFYFLVVGVISATIELRNADN